ncbi:cytochrome c biogenesis CcdA family protein [soil metagenome]
MQGESLGWLVAFSAGVLSFLSPCVLPLVPSYATFLTGMTVGQLTAEERPRARTRRAVAAHGMAFVLGFSAVFIVLGASVTFLGSLFAFASGALERVGGGLLILLGLSLLGVFRIPGASREWRVHLAEKPLGIVGSFVVGVAFGAGWTPCIGPVLGGILTLAATRGGVAEGVGLLAAYSAGLAVPFLLATLLLGRFLSGFGRVRRYLPWVSRASGVLLIGVGALMLTGAFSALTAVLVRMTPEALLQRL